MEWRISLIYSTSVSLNSNRFIESSSSSLQTFARQEDLEPVTKGFEYTTLNNAGHGKQIGVAKT